MTETQTPGTQVPGTQTPGTQVPGTQTPETQVPETRWHRATEWVGTEVEDSFVMINLDTGLYLTLNATAGAVWEALETPRTQGEIEAGLRDRFDVSAAECAEAVTQLLSEMRGHKLAAPV